jgi:hypothetical protein
MFGNDLLEKANMVREQLHRTLLNAFMLDVFHRLHARFDTDEESFDLIFVQRAVVFQ